MINRGHLARRRSIPIRPDPGDLAGVIFAVLLTIFTSFYIKKTPNHTDSEREIAWVIQQAQKGKPTDKLSKNALEYLKERVENGKNY